jgi:hypothetical protein
MRTREERGNAKLEAHRTTRGVRDRQREGELGARFPRWAMIGPKSAVRPSIVRDEAVEVRGPGLRRPSHAHVVPSFPRRSSANEVQGPPGGRLLEIRRE